MLKHMKMPPRRDERLGACHQDKPRSPDAPRFYLDLQPYGHSGVTTREALTIVISGGALRTRVMVRRIQFPQREQPCGASRAPGMRRRPTGGALEGSPPLESTPRLRPSSARGLLLALSAPAHQPST